MTHRNFLKIFTLLMCVSFFILGGVQLSQQIGMS